MRNFLLASNERAGELLGGGFSREPARRIACGETLIAMIDEATSIDELRDVMRAAIRDIYGLGQPVPPMSSEDSIS